jgi:hypothetical protein
MTDYVYIIVLLKLGYLVLCLLSFGYRNAFDVTSIMLSLNAYFEKCLEIIATFNDFTIQHVSRDENTIVDDLAQRASDFQSNREKLYVLEKPDVPVCIRCTMLKFVLVNQVQQTQMFQNQKPVGPVFLEVQTIWAK